ncbi:2-succinyl-5-enolpyruvyl-6-hydroxy-3-cyclohexene-1-carboxylic-acid synthase [Metabacillus fastidiosus]|uniref:2-succinyl-5-enolpyruvyl-6-hydroxy-3- cyclohexene-1-carboxylic-acid synthase n=1 Tax=Metabacillus fastidiosus TaxID=1458 RepID=UPI003D2DE195
MSQSDPLTKYVANFVDELARSGVEDVVISPGSRSTPLAILIAEHKNLTVHLSIDERSAGFFALGIAKVQKKPVALLCTSGTAAANYYPAIVEAYYARIPLVVITADRPHELRDIGAPQAIDQINIYGKYAKWFVDVALPEENSNMFRYVRQIASRAVNKAMTKPYGIVHLNFPLREPLLPNLNIENLWSSEDMRERQITFLPSYQTLSEEDLNELVHLLEGFSKGLIVCGEMDGERAEESIVELSNHLSFPILADPLSQLRTGKHNKRKVIDHYDTLLKDEEIITHLKPEVVIRFGAMPVSKPLMLMLKNNPDIIQIIIDDAGGYREPTLNGAYLVPAAENFICRQLINRTAKRDKSQFDKSWILANEICSQHINEEIAQINDLFEGKIYTELQKNVCEGCNLVIGNSMPIRDFDTYFGNTDKEIHVYGNRGANGIDGVVSTALGISLKAEAPTVLIIGDLSFFHDLNGLLMAKLYAIDLTVLLINNDGGGIFSFLPQSKEEKHFEALFGTPIGLDYEKAAQLYNGSYKEIEDWDQFRQFFEAMRTRRGLNIIEVPTDRNTRVEVHRELLQLVSQEIKKGLQL